MNQKCPGQDDRDLKAEIIHCPECGYPIEIFSDEVKIRCPKCKGLACRERLPSCIDWCKFARQCVGEEKWDYLKGKQ
ncbi:MAG: phosphohydrolase [Candidatus Omnitrophica bacterium]|nr:phosphohydrolase [Candidatus Omnitrophota bacterium]